MNANRLYSTSPDRSNKAYKLHLNCQSKIRDNPSGEKLWAAPPDCKVNEAAV